MLFHFWKKYRLYIAGLTLVAVTCCFCAILHNSEFRVVYSLDRKKNDQEIIRLINSADKYVYFAIYYFSKSNIADALVAAHNRGVTVWGIMDREASLDSNRFVLAKLDAAHIPVETQKHQDGIMHMKVIVTDKAYASGSYNWTSSATETNDEVLEVSTNTYMHNQYLAIIKKVLIANE